MRPILVLAVILLVLPACGPIDLPCPPFCAPAPGEPYDCDAPPEEGAQFLGPKTWKSGRVLIVLRRDPERAGLLPTATVFNQVLAEFDALADPKRLLNVGMIAADAELETVAKLLAHDAIQGVYPVQTYQLKPLEGRAVSSWGIDAIDARSGLDGKYEPRATGAGVRVIVNDTGVDRSHAYFEGRVSEDGHSAHPGTSPFYDGHGHGTHVAGTVAALNFGVAQKAIIHACKSLGDTGSGTTDQVIECVDFGVGIFKKYGDPVVGNMSLGGPPDPPLNEAVCRSHAAGVPWVVAAGNDYGESACNSSPAQVKQALTVMASNQGDALASFSSAGPCSDLIAPGEDIVSTQPGGGRQTMSGTSMACPHATGAVALCLGLNPEMGVGCLDEVLAWTTEGRISGVPEDAPDKFLYVGEEQ